MTRLDIINELKNRGYEAQAQESIKNGITFEGIVIRSESTIAPVIYTDPIINESETVEEASDKVLRLYEAHSTAPFDVDVLKDPNWILEHITIGLQLTSNETLVKRETEFEGIEQYLMLRGEINDSSYSLKVTPELLSTADIDTEDAWREAMIHICRDTHLISLDKIMEDMLGEDFDEAMMSGSPIHVITTLQKTKGAAAILNRDALSRFAREHEVDSLMVLPSSISEMLIIPFDDSMKLEDMSAMVKEVNDTQVAPEERLTDRAYILKV